METTARIILEGHETPFPVIHALGSSCGVTCRDHGLGLGISPGGNARSQQDGGGAKLRSLQQLLRRQPQPDRGISSVRANRVSQKRRVIRSLHLLMRPSVGVREFREWGLVIFHANAGCAPIRRPASGPAL
jgi:hypothetical protein